MVKRVVVGSTNPVKINAVASVVQRVWPGAHITGVAVESGVSVQPRSDDEAVAGATNRARAALALHPADLGVGLEGNTVETAFGMFSTGWAAVVDPHGLQGIGSSGRFPLPPIITTRVRQGYELGPLIDELTGGVNTKQGQGAVGVLSQGRMLRQQALEMAVLYALAPFLHPLYTEPAP